MSLANRGRLRLPPSAQRWPVPGALAEWAAVRAGVSQETVEIEARDAVLTAAIGARSVGGPLAESLRRRAATLVAAVADARLRRELMRKLGAS